MIIKNGLVHSLDQGFYPDTIYIEETRFPDPESDGNIPNGSIAALVINLTDCMKKAVSVGISLETAVHCASYNSACSVGVSDNLGSIKVGKQADCVLLSLDTLEVQAVIKSGRINNYALCILSLYFAVIDPPGNFLCIQI